jgi:hypothetical protein
MWQPAQILGVRTGDLFRYSVASDILWMLVASAAIVPVAAPVALRMYHLER